ncbi:iron ABC transporter permease [Vibrio albus]|uniref:Iron ABC transporter permease n=1 Tax=Vibrio albus TaxID=2200953 RepID=A0A2U3B7D3_9VIBR|nr:iron ABC transporter permease [Vibrio albus]PWI32672.1 iron ABC transporter permease [Vibrio albus]
MRKNQQLTLSGLSAVLALCLLLPVLTIFYLSAGQSEALFSHLFSTVLPIYTLNTVILVAGVMGVTLCLGVPTAWLMAMCRLPGEKFLQWALVLPLAMPGYIAGYIYTDWFDYAGPVQSLLRSLTGWSAGEYWFPDLRTLPGAIFILSLVLYPYVYLMARAAFIEQNQSLLQAARLLKCSPWSSFVRLSLPMARPSIAVALSLVAMESLGDFGTVSYFAVSTLTTAVYDTWLGYADINAAAKISAIMLVVIVLLISAERMSRRRQKQFQSGHSNRDDIRYPLQGKKKWVALIWCWGLLLAAFILPALQLVLMALDYLTESWTADFRQYTFNSLKVSMLAAMSAILIALILNLNHRLRAGKRNLLFMRLASMGYAVPGTVLAIGVLYTLTRMDHLLNDAAIQLNLDRPGLVLSGSIAALVFAMVIRFSAVAIGSVESHLHKIPPSLDMAGRNLGCNTSQMVTRIHLPLVRRGILIAGLLVFIESMKELNAALLLRPFNFETLATYVYNFASDEQLELAALPALLLVLVGLFPLIIINRYLEQAH